LLTERELEVALAVCEGNTTQQAADLLYVSKKTIDHHLGNIYTKLDLRNHNRAALATRLGADSTTSAV
jgi:DNA-binding CsgD family transcriptional regulator